MKRSIYLLLPLLSASVLTANAQDATWFQDITEQVGLEDIPVWRIYISDVNNDGYSDLLLENGIYQRNQLSLYLNLPDPEGTGPRDRTFVNVTELSGINANPEPGIETRVADVAALADVDNDGDVDLVTSRFYYAFNDYQMAEDRSEVLLNDGTGHFTIKENNGLHDLSGLNATGLAFIDYDHDGKLDVYVGTFSANHEQSVYMRDYLLRGHGDGTFTDVSTETGIATIKQPLYGVNTADWNNDGWQDVITSPYCRTPGSLWMNNGDGTFTDVAPIVGYSAKTLQGDNGQNLCQWEGQPADFDNDGDIDILQVMVHGGYNLGEGRTTIAINKGAEEEYKLEWDLKRLRRKAPATAHIGDMSGSWIDMDNDGLLDLVIAQSQYPQANQAGVERTYFMKQGADHFFDEITAELGLMDTLLAPGATEPFDFDLDGDDDLLVVRNTNRNQNNRLVMMKNNVGNKNNWIGLRLKAPEGVNNNAIGARITVTSGDLTQIREISAGRGHFGGQQPLTLNIGLGDRTNVDRIEVRWPGSNVSNTIVTDPPINQIVSIGTTGVSSVQELNFAAEARITPNPAKDRIRIELPLSIRNVESVSVHDALGVEVSRREIEPNTSEITLSTEELAAGYYFLTMRTAAGSLMSRSFIIEK